MVKKILKTGLSFYFHVDMKIKAQTGFEYFFLISVRISKKLPLLPVEWYLIQINMIATTDAITIISWHTTQLEVTVTFLRF
jgi:hypothetical protein